MYTLRVQIAKFILLVWFLFWIFRVESVQIDRPLSPGRTTVTSPYFLLIFCCRKLFLEVWEMLGRKGHEFRCVWDTTSINCALIEVLRDRTPCRSRWGFGERWESLLQLARSPARLGPAKIPVCCRPQENRSSKMRSNFAKSGA